MDQETLAWLTDPDSGCWDELGYQRFPLGEPELVDTVPPVIGWGEVRDHYDAVVIGSGAGGGVAAHVLAAAGCSVLVVERGRPLKSTEIGWDPVYNHRTAVFGFGEGVTPVGNPRAVKDKNGEQAVEPHDFRYHNNAVLLGGGPRLYGCQGWRFAPETFRMASEYGVPEGSALADWPITYDDLEPYYDLVEWEVGVAGAPGHTGDGPRSRGYPLPPFPPDRGGEMLADAAARLGWATAPVPLLINSQPYGGRPACANCSQCVGHPCPVDAKNGVHNTLLPQATAARAHILCDTLAARIDDGRGEVELRSEHGQRTVRADRIVVAAGAVETARLLMLSGLGNDWVGQCLQGHTYVLAHGHVDTDEPLSDGVGPGLAMATREHCHHNDGIIGGGMIADEYAVSPVQHWVMGSWFRPEHQRAAEAAGEIDEYGRPTGASARQALRDTYRRTIMIMGPIQEIPTCSAGLDLSAEVRDRWGLPVARFFGVQHEEDLRTAEFLGDRAKEWIAATGATDITGGSMGFQILSGGQHQAGTARMSHTPTGGAVDPEGKVWGCQRTYVADSALHVTNGGVNPVLSIMANSWRITNLLTR